ncbi:Tyrosine-protein phosphatase non-receptor type 11 [Trichoplax sp. H2]|nr:Tyrosine-protein phosphatase non-receptor type 11 [Trichoplax sp. H2]|eukprot:RDD42450.1 Tyrosine-protein phosphatase non-receptor type 11 [Trichoplax sp. H2]
MTTTTTSFISSYRGFVVLTINVIWSRGVQIGNCLHSKLTGAEAEQLLRTRGQVGSYLIRPSQTNPGDFVLSVKSSKDEMVHIRIQTNDNFYRIMGGNDFQTLSELLDYYKENPGELKAKDVTDEIILKYSLDCSDPSNDRWYHGSLSAREAEVLLLERGKNGSFLVRESKSKPGDYVLSDYQFDIGGGEKFENLSSLIDYYKDNPMVATSGTVITLKQPFNATRLTASSICERVTELEKEIDEDTGRSGFWEEFEMLQQQEMRHLFSRNEGQRSVNRSKNRYKNILPYDHTRVALINGNHSDGSDYINANYVFYEISRKLEKSYIATQGPLPNTVQDFWKMVWQEKSHIIIMLTKEVEKGKSKCATYWPQVASVLDFDGLMTVNCISEREITDFYVRKFVVTCVDEFEERIIYQYQYHSWPEHGVPASSAPMLKLFDQISLQCKEYDNIGPLIVHCSAGIGKTGAFITIDILRNIILDGGINVELDFQKTILAIRTQRSGLVQTQAQYYFIYRVMARFVWLLMEQIKFGETTAGNKTVEHRETSYEADNITLSTVPTPPPVDRTSKPPGQDNGPPLPRRTQSNNDNSNELPPPGLELLTFWWTIGNLTGDSGHIAVKKYEFSSCTSSQAQNGSHSLMDHSLMNYLQSEASVSNVSCLGIQNNPEKIDSQFSEFLSFVDNCEDLDFKNELTALLFPVFVHSFLKLLAFGDNQRGKKFLSSYSANLAVDNAHDIESLLRAIDEDNDSELVLKDYQSYKFFVNLSLEAFQYLINFLEAADLLNILSIINQHIFINTYIESTVEEIDGSEYPSQEIMEGDMANLQSNSSVDDKISKFHDVVNKAKESPTNHLPNIRFYTFLNAYQGLNTVSVSDNCKILCGGFADAAARLWYLNFGESFALNSEETSSHEIYEFDLKIEDQLKKKKNQECITLRAHSAGITSCSFSDDASYLFTASEDATVKLWNTEDLKCLVTYRGHVYPVWDVDTSKFLVYFATASADTTARLWSTEFTHPLRIFAGHLDSVNCVRFHPNCNYIATGSADKTCRLWDIQNGQTVRLFTGHKGDVMAMAFSPNGNYLATAGTDNSIYLWDISTGKLIQEYSGHTSPVYSISFSPCGTQIASGGFENCIKIWDVNGPIHGRFEDPNSDVGSTTFHAKATSVQFLQYFAANHLVAAGLFGST